VTTPVSTPSHPPGRVHGWLSSPVVLRRLAVATLVANVVLVVTGGLVRLTNSGLGCPTWPTCTDHTLTPTKAYAIHGLIEFTNRQLTFVLGLLALLTAIAAYRQKRQVGLAMVALGGIPAQAVLGGITVLTDLNPYAVASHLLLSMLVIAAYALLVWRLSDGHALAVPAAVRWLAIGLTTVAWVVLSLGTVVTGSGPHAGDLKAGTLHRIHLTPVATTQLHADAVWVLIGLTVGVLGLSYALDAAAALRPAVWALFGIELAQGLIGYTQYFLHVPPVLVAMHMLGACLVWLAALRVLFLVEPRAGATTPG